jgi:hypothetical protein
VDGDEHPGRERLAGAPKLRPAAEQQLPAPGEGAGPQQVADPAVAVGRRTAQCDLFPAGQQEWHIGSDRREPQVTGLDAAGQQRPDVAQHRLHALAALGQRDAGRLELRRVLAAHPDADAQPSRRERGERAQLLSQDDRMAQPGEQHARPEADAPGNGGDRGQGDDRLQDRMRVEQVIAQVDAIEAGRLGAPGGGEDAIWCRQPRRGIRHGREHQPDRRAGGGHGAQPAVQPPSTTR